MANRKSNDKNYKSVIINTAPGASGYYTDTVSSRDNRLGKMFMSIRGTFSATVTLQFKPVGDTSWTDYDTFTETTRQVIEDYTDCQWRVGVASGDYTSGTVKAGIDYGEY